MMSSKRGCGWRTRLATPCASTCSQENRMLSARVAAHGQPRLTRPAQLACSTLLFGLPPASACPPKAGQVRPQHIYGLPNAFSKHSESSSPSPSPPCSSAQYARAHMFCSGLQPTNSSHSPSPPCSSARCTPCPGPSPQQSGPRCPASTRLGAPPPAAWMWIRGAGHGMDKSVGLGCQVCRASDSTVGCGGC